MNASSSGVWGVHAPFPRPRAQHARGVLSSYVDDAPHLCVVLRHSLAVKPSAWRLRLSCLIDKQNRPPVATSNALALLYTTPKHTRIQTRSHVYFSTSRRLDHEPDLCTGAILSHLTFWNLTNTTHWLCRVLSSALFLPVRPSPHRILHLQPAQRQHVPPERGRCASHHQLAKLVIGTPNLAIVDYCAP